jgi:hypothetical protein
MAEWFDGQMDGLMDREMDRCRQTTKESKKVYFYSTRNRKTVEKRFSYRKMDE